MSKENKVILKEIREAIKNKKNVEAIKKCEDLLLIDPTNYMGLVLMGAAYQEKDKKTAAEYLKQAVEITKEEKPVVALQGLANCADLEELPNIYRRLLQLVPEKFADYHEKLVTISNINNVDACCDILHQDINLAENCNKRQESVLLSLGKIFTKTKQLPKEYDNKLIISALEKVLDSNCEEITKIDCYKLYFRQLYKNNHFDKLLRKASDMEKIYPNETNPLEWICQVYTTQNETMNFQILIEQSIEYYANKLLAIQQNSSLGVLVKVIIHYKNEQYIHARNLLLQIKNSNSNIICELLAKIYFQIGAYGLAENVYRKLNFKSLEFAISLCYSDDDIAINEGILILEEYSENGLVLLTLGRAYFKTKNEAKLKEVFYKLERLNCETLLKIFQIDFLVPVEEAIKILDQINTSTFELDLRRGKLLIELKQYEKSLHFLLNATKLKPYFADCFLYLGILYFNTNDIIRAKKCFEKCVNLNPCCEVAVNHLCAIYRSCEEWDLNTEFLSRTIKELKLQGFNAKLILFQQSLNYLDTKEFDKAIQILRMALRYDETNILFWEILAEAYFERGSYDSAINVYKKILDKESNHKYAKLQISIIKTRLRLYSESIEGFTELLSEDHIFLPALKGIAEAHYQLANYLLQHRLLGRCKYNLQKSLNYLQKVFLFHRSKKFVWLWRLSANIFTAVGCLPSNLSFLRINGILFGKESQEESIVYRNDLFELALKYYTFALQLNQHNTFLWEELSVCAYYYILHDENSDKQKLIELARKACKSSIKNEKCRWQTWNLLGVLYTLNIGCAEPNYSLAQHYFIKALQLCKNSAITWTNLGVIYFNIGEIKMANKTFTRSQESDPKYLNAWIGQAMIAEYFEKKEDAIDLFRHCTELDFHLESALGYSHWVCSILSNEMLMQKPHFKYYINNLYATSHALDSINWYVTTEDDKASVESLSYCGYLFSKKQLWLSAIKAYKLAVEKDNNLNKDNLFFNLGYCYLKADKPKLAIKSFNSLSEATLKSRIGLALSYRQIRDFQKSFDVYKSALEYLASTDEEKAEIVVAMSAIVYFFDGVEATKTYLYQCIDLQSQSIKALFSACALGIMHSDLQLTEAILDELKKLEDYHEYCHHIAFLTSQYYYAKKQSKQSYFYLISKIHTYPDRPLLRKVLADFLINYWSKTKKYSKGTCQISQSVITLQHKSLIRNDSLEAAKALLTASEAVKNIDKNKQKKLIQQAIHIHPCFQLAWNALSFCNI